MDVVEGKFIKECKSRFLAEVEVEQQILICYVHSSCKLSSVLSVKYGQKVLLSKTKSVNSIYFWSLFAIEIDGKHIIVNSSYANYVISNYYQNKLSTRIRREYSICGYKSDIFLPEKKTIVEIKSIISSGKIASPMQIPSKRILTQLKNIEVLLGQGFIVKFIFVSLSSSVEELDINLSPLIHIQFEKCIALGMKLIAVSLNLTKNYVEIKNIKISGVENAEIELL